jgi:DNA-binding FadR family transcriptional regulator
MAVWVIPRKRGSLSVKRAVWDGKARQSKHSFVGRTDAHWNITDELRAELSQDEVGKLEEQIAELRRLDRIDAGVAALLRTADDLDAMRAALDDIADRSLAEVKADARRACDQRHGPLSLQLLARLRPDDVDRLEDALKTLWTQLPALLDQLEICQRDGHPSDADRKTEVDDAT